jgi:NADH-quinone oxidoreductase subunit L
VLAKIGEDYHGIFMFTLHAFKHPPVYLAFAGIFVAWLCYIKFPKLPAMIISKTGFIHKVLLNKYGFDDFNQLVFARGTREIGQLLWKIGDVKIIDGLFVNGTARSVGMISNIVRNIQTGYLYHYAFAIIIGLLVLLGVFVHGILN